MKLIFALLYWTLAQAAVVVGPAYPPNAFNGGNVVAVLHLSAGTVTAVDVLTGDTPFVEPVQQALSGWRLNDTDNGNILVVVNFRTPNLYSTGSAAQRVTQADLLPGVAYPRTIVEPTYPANSLGQGSAVMRVALNDSGAVTKVKVIQGLGNLTAPCVAAVKKWRFAPARNGKGMAMPSEAYAVCVVRWPIQAGK